MNKDDKVRCVHATMLPPIRFPSQSRQFEIPKPQKKQTSAECWYVYSTMSGFMSISVAPVTFSMLGSNYGLFTMAE